MSRYSVPCPSTPTPSPTLSGLTIFRACEMCRGDGARKPHTRVQTHTQLMPSARKQKHKQTHFLRSSPPHPPTHTQRQFSHTRTPQAGDAARLPTGFSHANKGPGLEQVAPSTPAPFLRAKSKMCRAREGHIWPSCTEPPLLLNKNAIYFIYTFSLILGSCNRVLKSTSCEPA